MEHQRIRTLDYLRGLAAFGIMIYHYYFFCEIKYSPSSFIAKTGVYGVSLFYVLSGLTLYYVYYKRMIPSINDVTDFFIKRVFRIFPLLWLVTILTSIVNNHHYNWKVYLLNLSGLFGIIKRTDYIGMGVWSIGNELVFYLFFPLFVICAKRSKIALLILSITLFSIYIYFAFFGYDTTKSLSWSWITYINPLNQVFLFLGGFLIGYLFEKRTFPNYILYSMLITALLVFNFYPIESDTIEIVSGYGRIIFTLLSFMIVFSVYKIHFRFPKLINQAFTKLGEASYSVYLLHPVIYYSMFNFIGFINTKFNIYIRVAIWLPLTFIATLVISYGVYIKFEKYFTKLGRTISKRFIGLRTKV